MNTNRIFALSFGLLVAPLASPAQDGTNAAPLQGATNSLIAWNATNAAPSNVDIEKIRKDVREFHQAIQALDKLPPEEATKKRGEMNLKRNQQLQGLSPAERRAWLEEWRRKTSVQAGPIAAERRAKAIKERLEMLRAKKAEGKTTEVEDKAIERLESLEKELKEKAAAEKAAEQPEEKSVGKPGDSAAGKPANKPAEKSDPAKN